MDFIAPAIVSAGMMKTQEAVRSEMRVAGRRKKA